VRQAVEESVRTGRRGTPIEEIVPDWDERVAAAGRRRGRVSYRPEFEGAALVQLNGLPKVAFDALAEQVAVLVLAPYRQRPRGQ
jgi:hypothetical protein